MAGISALIKRVVRDPAAEFISDNFDVEPKAAKNFINGAFLVGALITLDPISLVDSISDVAEVFGESDSITDFAHDVSHDIHEAFMTDAEKLAANPLNNLSGLNRG